MTTFSVAVPGTLSNLGPGFDVLGMAVSIHNRFIFTVTDKRDEFEAYGKPIKPNRHLALKTIVNAVSKFGGELPGGICLEQEESVPRSRGLGSSATARVAGLIAYMKLTKNVLSEDDQVAFLSKAEGHPDNVTPALRGGLTLCTRTSEGLQHLVFKAPKLKIALCIPEKTISTKAARRILPQEYSRKEVVFSTSRMAFLLAGLIAGKTEALEIGCEDRIHQPYRKTLIGPVDRAFSNAKEAGAYSAFISGSGSTLAAFVPSSGDAMVVAQAMAAAFAKNGPACQVRAVRPSNQGAYIE